MNLAPIVTLIILVALGVLAWSKSKAPIAGWKVGIVLALAGVLVFFLFGSPVEDTTPRSEISNTSELLTFREILARAPWLQLVVMGSGMLLLLIGAYVIVYFHNQRLGKRWWSILNPLQTPYKDFNRREWVQFGVLLAVSFVLLVIGVNLGHGR